MGKKNIYIYIWHLAVPVIAPHANLIPVLKFWLLKQTMWCITFAKMSRTSSTGQLQKRRGERDELGSLNDDRNLILGWSILLTYCFHCILAGWYVCVCVFYRCHSLAIIWSQEQVVLWRKARIEHRNMKRGQLGGIITLTITTGIYSPTKHMYT